MRTEPSTVLPNLSASLRSFLLLFAFFYSACVCFFLQVMLQDDSPIDRENKAAFERDVFGNSSPLSQ